MNRGYNFGAGPAMLPEELLYDIQSELLNWQGLGMSVMEVGHRTQEFTELMSQAEAALRNLLSIPSTYQVLFLGSAARLQFSMLPLNLLNSKAQGGYLITGLWSSLAYQEACHVKQAYCIASSEACRYQSVPPSSEWQFKDNTAYLYYTPNETVNGVRCVFPPRHHNIPLIADMTSCLLTETINVKDYGFIFAGAQKNIANAGLTIAIVRDDLLDSIKAPNLPTMLDYRTHASNKSLYATPPTFNCYVALKMFQWIERQGGVAVLAARNQEKATKLYQFIDLSPAYHCPIAPDSRSLVNICFNLRDSSLIDLFLEKAKQRGLFALKGHREVGGLRASLYNSMPMEGVNRLIEFMSDFAKEHP
jgi:phosphoserine aminotransferase